MFVKFQILSVDEELKVIKMLTRFSWSNGIDLRTYTYIHTIPIIRNIGTNRFVPNMYLRNDDDNDGASLSNKYEGLTP